MYINLYVNRKAWGKGKTILQLGLIQALYLGVFQLGTLEQLFFLTNATVSAESTRRLVIHRSIFIPQSCFFMKEK